MATISAWLWSAPVWVTAAILFASMLLAWLGGRGVRKHTRRRQLPDGDAEEKPGGYLVSEMLGLLGLLLAFTFGLVIERFDTRRVLVLEEANAIGTSYLRAQLLDEPHRERISSLLQAYVDNRLELAAAAGGKDQLLALNDRLLTQIWSAVIAANGSAQSKGISVSMLQSFNEMIDLDTARKVSRLVRVPTAVFLVLFIFVIVSAGVLGANLEGRRGRTSAMIMFALLTLYMTLVADLNRPLSGMIRESQEPMLLLQKSLKEQPPAAFDRYAPATRAPAE